MGLLGLLVAGWNLQAGVTMDLVMVGGGEVILVRRRHVMRENGVLALWPRGGGALLLLGGAVGMVLMVGRRTRTRLTLPQPKLVDVAELVES